MSFVIVGRTVGKIPIPYFLAVKMREKIWGILCLFKQMHVVLPIVHPTEV